MVLTGGFNVFKSQKILISYMQPKPAMLRLLFFFTTTDYEEGIALPLCSIIVIKRRCTSTTKDVI
jgi:hypothetical protein